MRVFVIGIPLVGTVVVLLAHYFFGVKIWLGVIAVPLVVHLHPDWRELDGADLDHTEPVRWASSRN